MDLGLTGKVYMVAAASKGLGYAVAQALAREGASVSIGSRTAPEVEEAARTLEQETGSPVMPYVMDVTDPTSMRNWLQDTLERFKGLDGLVTNAGGPPLGGFEKFQDEDWQAAFELNLLSAVRLVRVAMPALRLRKGSILMLASTTAREPQEFLILSNVMRAGAIALMKSLSRELAPDGIRVNALMPGRLATDRINALDAARAEHMGIPLEEFRTQVASEIPLGRLGEPAELGRAAAFLLSPAAAYITGTALAIDGGLLRTV